MNWLVLFGELLLAQSWLGSNQAASWATWSVSKDCFQLPKPRSLKLIKFLPGGEQGEGQGSKANHTRTWAIPEQTLFKQTTQGGPGCSSPLTLLSKGKWRADRKCTTEAGKLHTVQAVKEQPAKLFDSSLVRLALSTKTNRKTNSFASVRTKAIRRKMCS